MESLKQNYDRVLLVVFGLLALALGILLSMKALALPDKFAHSEASEKADYGPSGVATIDSAIKHADAEIAWSSPSLEGVPQKPLPLLISIPIWVQNSAEIDLLDPSSPQIRPPVDNAYLHKHGLPAGNSNLLVVDGDGDGFNTLEEFEAGKTDPTDKADHPPFTNKLTLAEIKKDEYILDFRTSGGPGPAADHSIREETVLFQGDAPKRKTHFKKLGEVFGLHPGHVNRYKIIKLDEKQRAGKGGVMIDAPELTIEDLQTPGVQFKITKGKLPEDPHVATTFYAVFHYALPGFTGNLEGFFKVGQSFELPNDPGTKYKVLELSGKLEDGVQIRVLAPGETPKDLTIPPMQKSG